MDNENNENETEYLGNDLDMEANTADESPESVDDADAIASALEDAEVIDGESNESGEAFANGEVKQESGEEDSEPEAEPDTGELPEGSEEDFSGDSEIDTYDMPSVGEQDQENNEIEPDVDPEREVTLADCMTGGATNTIEGQLDLAILKFQNDRKVFLERMENLDASCGSESTCELIAQAARLV